MFQPCLQHAWVIALLHIHEEDTPHPWVAGVLQAKKRMKEKRPAQTRLWQTLQACWHFQPSKLLVHPVWQPQRMRGIAERTRLRSSSGN